MSVNAIFDDGGVATGEDHQDKRARIKSNEYFNVILVGAPSVAAHLSSQTC